MEKGSPPVTRKGIRTPAQAEYLARLLLHSLSQIVKMGRKTRFTYEYDFGDSWQHEIVLEKTLEPEPRVRYPRCVEGERACPPEDCGGVWGYAELREAIADPKHESHEEMLEWIGGEFDPERFSVDEVNKELGKHH